jgi:hypothetical protein
MKSDFAKIQPRTQISAGQAVPGPRPATPQHLIYTSTAYTKELEEVRRMKFQLQGGGVMHSGGYADGRQRSR